MQDPVEALTVQFLEWLSTGQRTYTETMEAWRTSCPRLPVWEDAVDGGLVLIENGRRLDEAKVVLTSGGKEFLAARRLSVHPAPAPLSQAPA